MKVLTMTFAVAWSPSVKFARSSELLRNNNCIRVPPYSRCRLAGGDQDPFH